MRNSLELKDLMAAWMPRGDLLVFVDLDGALLRTDTFFECLFALLARKPLYLVLLPLWLLKGWDAFRREIVKRAALPVETLPYREELIGWLRAVRESGATTVLVSANERPVAQLVADHTACFDFIVAANERKSAAGGGGAACLVERLSSTAFGYVASRACDVTVLEKAQWVVAVNPGWRLRRALRQGKVRVRGVLRDRPAYARSLLRAARVVQWAKNALLFVPLLLSHRFTDTARVLGVLVACMAFCLYASALYMLNDLADLAADRRHRTKRARPFASGDLPLYLPLVLSPVLIGVAVWLALSLGREVLLWLLIYAALSLSYVYFVKARLFLDVMVLAGLYTVRLFAGSTAAHVAVSPWLAAFALFLFLGLALVKRCSELWGGSGADGLVPGRGYGPADVDLLAIFGCASGYLSCLVLALYINSADVARAYKRPAVLWLLVPLLLYWLSRLWLLARRGSVEQDPVAFTLKDTASWFVALFSLLVLFGAGMQ
jgi:4-hydroxybenzoate polyprenyltransferase